MERAPAPAGMWVSAQSFTRLRLPDLGPDLGPDLAPDLCVVVRPAFWWGQEELVLLAGL